MFSAIPAFVLIVGVILILIYRQRCPRRLPRCLRPSHYIKNDEHFTADSALEEIVVDSCSSSEILPLQTVYTHSPASTGYPAYTLQSMNASLCQTFPTSSCSSLSSSTGSEDGLPSLDNDRRGRKRKRISSSDDDSDHWMLEERHYLLPHPPLTEADGLRRLEKSFTGEIPDGGKPEFFIYNWENE